MSASEVEGYARNRGAFYGTASTIGETVDEFIDLGCQGFMVYCNSAPKLEALERLSGSIPLGFETGSCTLKAIKNQRLGV